MADQSEEMLIAAEIDRVKNTQRMMRDIGMFFLAVVLICLTGYVIIVRNFQTIYSAGLTCLAFTICTWLFSIRIIIQHYTHWYQPDLQKFVVRILWMAPIYSTDSLLTLFVPKGSPVLSTIRELYESFTIYSFFRLLTTLVAVHTLLQKEELVRFDWCTRIPHR